MPLHLRRGDFTFLVADGAALRHGLATGEIRGDDEVYDEMSGQWRQAAQAVSGTWAAPQVAVWSQAPAAPDPRSSQLPSMTVPPTYHASMPAVAPRGPADWKRMMRTVGTALFVLLGVGTWIVVTAVRHSGTSGGQSESPATGLIAGADGGGTSVTVTVQTPWTASSMEPSDEVEASAVPIPEPVPEPYIPPPPPPPPEPTPAETIADKATLGSAIDYARPFMTDTQDELCPGAFLLAIWAAEKLRWAELQEVPDTTFARIMKDPDFERGKRICMRGQIISIAVDRTELGRFYEGQLIAGNYDDVIDYIAVGSTGDLVAKNRARFCGIVTGRNSYSNTGGGITHAVRAIGMFEIPDNTGRRGY